MFHIDLEPISTTCYSWRLTPYNSDLPPQPPLKIGLHRSFAAMAVYQRPAEKWHPTNPPTYFCVGSNPYARSLDAKDVLASLYDLNTKDCLVQFPSPLDLNETTEHSGVYSIEFSLDGSYIAYLWNGSPVSPPRVHIYRAFTGAFVASIIPKGTGNSVSGYFYTYEGETTPNAFVTFVSTGHGSEEVTVSVWDLDGSLLIYPAEKNDPHAQLVSTKKIPSSNHMVVKGRYLKQLTDDGFYLLQPCVEAPAWRIAAQVKESRLKGQLKVNGIALTPTGESIIADADGSIYCAKPGLDALPLVGNVNVQATRVTSDGSHMIGRRITDRRVMMIGLSENSKLEMTTPYFEHLPSIAEIYDILPIQDDFVVLQSPTADNSTVCIVCTNQSAPIRLTADATECIAVLKTSDTTFIVVAGHPVGALSAWTVTKTGSTWKASPIDAPVRQTTDLISDTRKLLKTPVSCFPVVAIELYNEPVTNDVKLVVVDRYLVQVIGLIAPCHNAW